MAFQSKAITSFLLLNIILAMAGHTLAARAGPIKQKEDETKQPDWFIGRDGSVHLPGVGRIKVPHVPGSGYGGYRLPPYPTYSSIPGVGNGGNTGSGFIPGGDNTFVPNPGYEVPIPSAP